MRPRICCRRPGPHIAWHHCRSR